MIPVKSGNILNFQKTLLLECLLSNKMTRLFQSLFQRGGLVWILNLRTLKDLRWRLKRSCIGRDLRLSFKIKSMFLSAMIQIRDTTILTLPLGSQRKIFTLKTVLLKFWIPKSTQMAHITPLKMMIPKTEWMIYSMSTGIPKIHSIIKRSLTNFKNLISISRFSNEAISCGPTLVLRKVMPIKILSWFSNEHKCSQSRPFWWWL